MDIYHVFNRGVEKRDIVNDDDDRMRFVRSLYIFNDKNPAPNSITQSSSCNMTRSRECLVVIHAWCLMNNHYHLLLSPVNDEYTNLSLFIKKLNMGYAKFFNEKYNRSGYLWQGKYKKVQIKTESQILYIPYYIHLNPLDYKMKEWRTGTISNTKQALSHLSNYRWSSFLDYSGKLNFSSLINTKLLKASLGNFANQRREIDGIIAGNNTEHYTKSLEMEFDT